jgi:glycine/D-amino acid oxidase-like deaminating enzyme
MGKIPITTPGGWVQARSVVVAVGYWHNEFMKKHFAPEACSSPDFVGVASQTAIYTLPSPLPPTPASVFSYSPGAVLTTYYLLPTTYYLLLTTYYLLARRGAAGGRARTLPGRLRVVEPEPEPEPEP